MQEFLYIRYLVAAVYLSASIMYIALLRSGKKQTRAPTVLFKVGLVIHAIEITARGAEAGAAGGAPFASISGFLSVFAFLFGIMYLVIEWRYRRFHIASLGAFHIPVLFVLHAVACFLKQPIDKIPSLNTGAFFIVHVTPSLLAYAAFAVGFITAVAYLLLDRQLRKRKFGVLVRGLPNLEFLERVNAASVKLGLPFLVAGAAIGLAMAYYRFGAAYKWDVKVWVTAVSITIFSIHLLSRRFAGWKGRRTVVISALGFSIILLSATVVNLFLSSLHGFS